jgi:DNA sulfur modification protein DndD
VILVRLRLHNFRPYRGDHELAFAFDKTRNVTVVTGLNGSGKTSLFHALNWVLYGSEGIPEGIVNRTAAKSDRDARARVELEFLHEGKRYVARRVQRIDGSGVEREDDFTLEEHGAGGRIESIANPTPRINVILPIDAKPYFFFDADRFREFVLAGQQSMVLEAARSVLKLKVLERMAQHLRDSAKDYRKNFRDVDASHEQLFVSVDNLEASIAAAQETLAKAKEVAAGRDVLLANVKIKLSRLAEAAEDQRLEDAAVKRVEAFENELRAVDRRLHESMGRSASIVAAAAVLQATQVLDEKRVRGEVPSGIKHQLIEDLVAHGVCICGRPLDAAARQALDDRRRMGVSDAVAEQIAGISGNLRALEVRSETTLKSLRELTQRRSELDDLVVDAERKLDEIQERRRGKNFTEDIQKLEDTRRALENAVIEARTDVRLQERQIEQSRDELQKTAARLAAAKAKSAAAEVAKARYELATRSADAADLILERYGSEKRKLIEHATDEMFRKFHWKAVPEEVHVSDDYRLQVLSHGMDDLAGRSEGEKQMLSLAFLVAMTKVSGEDAPLVIDTPFARLSNEPATNILRELPDLAQQLVLLVTDREIEADGERVLAPRIGKRYLIRWDDTTGESSLEVQA